MAKTSGVLPAAKRLPPPKQPEEDFPICWR